MNKFLSIITLFFNSIINMLVPSAYAMDTWDIVKGNTLHIYTRQDREVYKHHRGNSEIYGAYNASPKAPIFSTYFPESHSLALTAALLYAHIPLSSFLKLPVDIRTEMKLDGVDPRSTKIFVVGQYIPSKGADSFIGFYPHFGTEPTAPAFGDYDVTRQLKLMLTGSDSKKVRFERMRNESESLEIMNVESGDGIKSAVQKKSAITHPLGADKEIVVSPVPIHVVGIGEDGDSFYSYVSYSDEGVKKAVVTLHILWNYLQVRKFSQWIKSECGLDTTSPTLTLRRSFRNLGSLLHEKPFQKFDSLLQGVSLKEAVSSPEAFGATFDPGELITAYDLLKAREVGMPATEIVKNIFIQRGYRDWNTLSEKEEDWVVSKISLGAERIRLEELVHKLDAGTKYRSVRASGNNASDGELVAFLLGITETWKDITPENRTWVVAKVKSDVQRLELGELAHKSGVVTKYRSVRASGNNASDGELVAFLLGITETWKDITPENRTWVVAKVKSDVQRLELGELAHKSGVVTKYRSVRASGNNASDGELVAFLLGITEMWKDITPENRTWVISLAMLESGK